MESVLYTQISQKCEQAKIRSSTGAFTRKEKHR